MKSVFNKILIIVICCIYSQYGITQNVGRDSLIVRDTLNHSLIQDSTFRDSIPKPYTRSPDAITSVIKYGAVDSNRTDIVHKEVHLFGSAYTDYETIKLRADYIVFNFNTSVVSAYRSRDSVHIPKELPSFVDGETKAGFSSMRYNFKTKKALVKTLSTKESEFYLIGEKSKYIGKENDSIYHEDRFFNQNAIITTCNHPTPHFGIRTRKMKFIPDQIAVMGPAQLEIAGIPTPIILPFGFFPLIRGQSSGLIFPSDFPYDNNYGFGIRGVGYYFPINDYVDARITGDIWTRGSHAVRVQTNYKKRYKYAGNIELNYANNILEDAKGVPNPQKSFGLRISHNQDAKAHPYRSIGGSVNIETNRNRQRTNYDYQSITNNKLYSNFNFIYRWPESPFSLRAAFSHNQDNRTRVVNITLPDASLNMNTIQPFKRKNSSGDPLWYENVSVSYRAGLKNFVKTTDTTLFTRATLENIETGFSHGTSISSNARVLKYFNLSPSMIYDEAYFLKTLEKTFDPNPVLDTIVTGIDAEGNPQTDIRVSKYGTVYQKLSRGLEVFRKFNTSISMNTQLFAIKQWKSGWLRGVRHIMKPSVSFNYAPDTDLKYRKFVDTDSRPDQNTGEYYNPFQTGAFPQSLNEKQMSISYNIVNVFEAKYRNRRDTVDKKLSLFNNLVMSGNYNFARDSLKWSDVVISGNTNVLKGLTNLQLTALFTPYEINFKSKRRIDQKLIDRSNHKKLLQLVSFNAGLNTSLSFSQIKGLFKGKSTSETAAEEAKKEKQQKQRALPSLASLFDNLRFSHALTMNTEKTTAGRDSFFLGAHSLYISGSIPLSKNWNFNIGSISYDFVAKALVYPSFSFSRDLHCWNMNFAWYPDNGVYSFFIGVKSASLNFLKYDYTQPYIPRF